MKKLNIITLFFTIVLFFVANIDLSAQDQKIRSLEIDDGTTTQDMNTNSVLDIQSDNKGVLLPRIALTRTDSPAPLSQHVAGMTVYNTATSAPSVPFEYYVSPGLYYNDGSKWVRMPLGYTNWFYMPSVSFNTSVVGTGFTKDLYDLYKSQFQAPVVKSPSAPVSVPYLPGPTDVYYYITYYDPAVFANVSINDNGVMTYDVISAASDCSYINIIFVLK
jgi:hypothetical protein